MLNFVNNFFSYNNFLEFQTVQRTVSPVAEWKKAAQCQDQYTVKKVSGFPVPSQDVTNQTLSGWE